MKMQNQSTHVYLSVGLRVRAHIHTHTHAYLLLLAKIMKLAYLENGHHGKNYTLNSNNLIEFV